MVLSALILIILIYILIKHYEYGVILIVSLHIWFNLFAVAGSNILTYATIFATILFLKDRKYKFALKKMPASCSLVFISISYCLTGFFAESPNILPAILNSIRESLMLIVFYHVFIRNKGVLSVFFIKSSMVFVFAFVFMTIVEFITGENQYIKFINSIGAYRVDTYIDSFRYGFKRCQSLFSMHTTLGGAALLTCTPIGWYYYTKNKHVLTILVCIFCAILCAYASGARSTIIGCIVAMFTFFNKKYITPKRVLSCLLLIFILYVNLNEEINTVIDSIINNDSIGGSSEDMRMNQLLISLNYLNKNFMLGNGVYAWTDIVQKTDLYGAESIWFGLMIDRGFIGLLSLVLFNLQLFYYIYINKMPQIAFFLLAFLITASLTSLPNIIYTYIYAPIIIMISLGHKINQNKI